MPVIAIDSGSDAHPSDDAGADGSESNDAEERERRPDTHCEEEWQRRTAPPFDGPHANRAKLADRLARPAGTVLSTLHLRSDHRIKPFVVIAWGAFEVLRTAQFRELRRAALSCRAETTRHCSSLPWRCRGYDEAFCVYPSAPPRHLLRHSRCAGLREDVSAAERAGNAVDCYPTGGAPDEAKASLLSSTAVRSRRRLGPPGRTVRAEKPLAFAHCMARTAVDGDWSTGRRCA